MRLVLSLCTFSFLFTLYGQTSYWKEINSSFEAEDYVNAIHLLQLQRKIYPDTWVFLRLGYAFEALNNHDSAIFYYSKSIESNKYMKDAFVARGKMYQLHGQYQEAIRDFNRAVEINEDYDTIVAFHRGLSYAKSGMFKESIDDFRRSVKMRPENEPAVFNLAFANYQIENIDSAQFYFRRVLSINRRHHESRFYLSEIYKKKGQLLQARKELEFLMANIEEIPNPENFLVSSSLGYLHYDLMDYKEAARVLELANRLYDQDPKSFFVCGLAYYYSENDSKAIHNFEMSIEIDPANSAAIYLIGTILEQRKPGSGCNYLNKAKALDSNISITEFNCE